MPAKKTWRDGSKREMIAQCARAGKTRKDAFSDLRQLTENGIAPMVFSANVNGHRIPKPLSRQLLELKFEINRVYRLLEIAGNDLPADEDAPDGDDGNEPDEMPEDDSETPDAPEDDSTEDVEDKSDDEMPEDDKPVKASGKEKMKDAMREFLSETRRIRDFCSRREATGENVDSISLRPLEAAVKLIPAGVPVDALLAAMCLDWKDGEKRDAGIPEFDFAAFSRGIMKDRGIPFGEYHELFGYALTLAENRVPVFLIGGFGTGKSVLASQTARYLGLEYSEAPMNNGASRNDLLGRWVGMDKLIPAHFPKRYVEGGVFNFEEIDASDGGLLITLNNAIANDQLHNVITGEVYTKHGDFIPFATGNTFGKGATRSFSAREKQDDATLDRWRMGRIVVPIDPAVENAMAGIS